MPAPLGFLLRRLSSVMGASALVIDRQLDPQDYTPPVVNIAYNPIPIGTYYRQVHHSAALSRIARVSTISFGSIGLPQLGLCSKAYTKSPCAQAGFFALR